MLKFPFLFLLLITALPLVGQEPYSLAQFPFKIIGDVDPYLADFLEESILSELTSSTAITIKDIWNEEIDKEVEDLSGLTETAIVELGEKWNFDLFLTGYLAMERGELILFYQVYTTDKGICILAKRISVQPEDIIQEAKKLGRELVQELTWIRSVDLDTYMDSMLSLELFDEIYRFLYAREHLVSGEDLRQYSQRLALEERATKLKEFYTALDEKDLELAFILINELSEMSLENDKELDKAAQAYKKIRLEQYKEAVTEWEEHLENSNYKTIEDKWKLFLEAEGQYSSVKELDLWSREMRVRKETYLVSLAQSEYLKASNDIFPFRDRIKYSFRAQNLYFQAFQVRKKEAFIKEIDRCIDLQSRLYDEYYKGEEDFFNAGLRESFYSGINLYGAVLSDPQYTMGGLNGMCVGYAFEFLWLMDIHARHKLSLGGTLTAYLTDFNSTLNSTDYITRMGRYIINLEPAYYYNLKYFDFFMGPTLPLGVQSLDMTLTMEGVPYQNQDFYLLSGLGFQVGTAFYPVEWVSFILKIRHTQLYHGDSGFLPVTEAGIGLRIGFTP
jgi:hypothetical protein